MSTNAENGGFGKNWNDKLRLLDAIDAMREPVEAAPGSLPERPAASGTGPVCVEALQEKLHVYEQTCAMLEREVQVLEQQTLAALAEAGRLRRELDRSRAREREEKGQSVLGMENIRRIISDSENERRLLLDALENSESELARMVKTLDLVARKLQVA